MSSWILAGVGSLGEAFIGSLMGKISDYVIGRVLEEPGVADLHDLRNTLSGTERTIGRVENMWIKDEDEKKRLKELLMKLRDTAYDADDLIDEIQFQAMKQQIEQQGAQRDEASNRSSSSSGLPPRKKRKNSVPEVISRFFGRRDDVIRVREVRVKLDKYTADIEHFIATIDADEKQMIASVVPRTTTSFPVETQVFGREEQLNQLLEQLMQSADGSSNSSISTITIVGIGGVGKTTLAQQAYNHARVKDYFQKKVWVCVSDNFDVKRLTKDIIDSLTPHKRDLNNLDALQVAVKEELTSKRFLLVLDDVWNEDSLKWERFCAPLRYGEPGSKILVTTRSRKIADMVGNPIPLDGLDKESYWELFKQCAFGSQDTGECPQLEAIAKKIAGRLKGLPLAARTVGGLLKAQMNEEHWRNIAGSEIWQLPQDEGSVLPVLQLSYQCLPAHLKRCFVFCSLFPKDYSFYDDELIRLWMAEGYVAQDNNMTMEDVGSRCFLELVNRSFFQEAPLRSEYVMHDLIHDLAQFIAEGEFCRIEDNDESKEIPNTTRHLSATLTDETKLLEFFCCEKLRTLTINYESDCYRFGVESSSFPIVLFERLKNIRVLILRHCGLVELPDTIGDLIHLRYLDVSYNSYIWRLPESLCGLYNLRVLNLMDCLRGLSSFKVLKDQGHEVAQLAGLTQLHGRLRITSLENVESKQEASKAELNNKQYLDELVLEWTSILDGNESVVLEEVLEGLQPHQALKGLTIRRYNGVRSPSWLQAQSLANLITLELEYCKAWEDLSCIGQLPNLKNLYVKRMPAVKQISQELSTESKFLPNLEELVLEDMVALEELPWLGRLPCLKVLCIMGMSAVTKLGHGFFGCRDEGKCFPCLEELRFIDMPEWEEWSWADGRELFPCLRKLRICRCPRLKRLPPLSPSLESLSLCQVGLTEVTGLWEEIDGSCAELVWQPVKGFEELTSLTRLSIRSCPKLLSMTQYEDMDILLLPTSIEVLQLSDCGNLKKLLPGCLHNLTSLTQLEIGGCPSIESLPATSLLHLKRLKSLSIWKCGELRSIDGLRVLESLRELTIKLCPKLLPNEGNEQVEEGLSVSKLCVDDAALFKASLLRRTLPSVRVLTISNFPRATMCDEEQQWLQSLTSLRLLEFENCKNLQSLPIELYALPSLRLLRIVGCPEIRSLPEKGLPTSLQNLSFDDCHLTLTEQLEKHLAEMKSSSRFFPVDRWDIYEGIY